MDVAMGSSWSDSVSCCVIHRAPRFGECSHAVWRFCGSGTLPWASFQGDQGAPFEMLTFDDCRQ